MRGAVRIRSYTAEPAAIAGYGPLTDAAGKRRFRLKVIGMTRGNVVATIDGVTDRTAAEALRGTVLHVARAALPPPDDDEFYHEDLIGLPVELADGTPLGTVAAIVNFGAGDVVEVRRPGAAAVYVPFTREAVPVVDLAARRVVAAPPPGLLDDGDGDGGGEGARDG